MPGVPKIDRSYPCSFLTTDQDHVSVWDRDLPHRMTGCIVSLHSANTPQRSRRVMTLSALLIYPLCTVWQRGYAHNAHGSFYIHVGCVPPVGSCMRCRILLTHSSLPTIHCANRPAQPHGDAVLMGKAATSLSADAHAFGNMSKSFGNCRERPMQTVRPQAVWQERCHKSTLSALKLHHEIDTFTGNWTSLNVVFLLEQDPTRHQTLCLVPK